MPLVVPNSGELELLDKLLKDALVTNEDYILKLYKVDVTPDENSVPGTFTEADFSGYSSKTLNRASWSSAMTVSGEATSQYSQQSWTCGATGNTVYGYFVLGSNSGTLLWAERFTASRLLEDGDVFQLTPTFSLKSEV
jgi:hypothetical protein